jgi:hypothetical protein
MYITIENEKQNATIQDHAKRLKKYWSNFSNYVSPSNEGRHIVLV